MDGKVAREVAEKTFVSLQSATRRAVIVFFVAGISVGITIGMIIRAYMN